MKQSNNKKTENNTVALTITKKDLALQMDVCVLTRNVGIIELIYLKRNILVSRLKQAQVGQQMLPVDDPIRASLIDL